MQRRAPYAWRCLACAKPNAAHRDHCARCACPAYATLKQVEFSQRQLKQKMPPAAASPVREAAVFRVLAVVLVALGWILTSYAAPFGIFLLGILATLLAAWLWRLGAQASNHSIEATAQSPLRALWPAPHVER